MAQGKEHQPTEETRKTVYDAASVGIDQEAIARMLHITAKTLRVHYRDELDSARDWVHLQVSRNVIQKALEGDMDAAKFLLTMKHGWKKDDITLGGKILVEYVKAYDEAE